MLFFIDSGHRKGHSGLTDAFVRGIGFAFIASGIGFALRFIGDRLCLALA